MPSVAIDFDDTLVGYKKYPRGEWLPGAKLALKRLKRRGYTIVIHSCRLSWPEGRQEVIGILEAAGFQLGSRLKLHDGPGKPLAVAYVDDRGVHFDGDWPAALRRIKELT
jgi:hypothetical protein